MSLSTKFICATREYSTFQKNIPAPYFRKKVMLEALPLTAELSICGLGFYELFINGKRITKGFLAPYISNPDDLIYYDRYEIKENLRVGENVIGVLLGNGMQNSMGGEIWEFNTARWRSAPKLALSLEMKFPNDEFAVIYSDEDFKTAPSPIIMDDLRAGEFYDARNEITGWNLPGFDDTSWSKAIKTEAPRGEITICHAEPIVVTKELEAVAIRKSKISLFPKTRENLPVIQPLEDESDEKGWLYDFGVNAAGVCKLKVKGERGQKIVLQFGELLAEDGGMDLRAMTFLPERFNHRDIYICKGGEEEIYRPTFTYHGFRYCFVMGITREQATKELLTYEIMNSDLCSRGGFECSDKIANALWNATIVSDLSNFYYFPTDCPHREKNGWTGDAALSAEQMLCSLSVENSYKEWLRNIRKAQNAEGALPGIIPTAGWGFSWGNGPAWDSVLIYLPYYTWLYRGDIEILQENAIAIFRYINYLSIRCDEKGLLHIGLGDWCHVARQAGNPKAPLVVTDTLIAMDICEKSAKIFDILHMDLQKEFTQKLYYKLRGAAREHLINYDTMTVLGDCQSSQAMAIYYKLFKEEEKNKAFEVLLRLIKQSNNSMDVGILGARVLFHVLSDFDETELAFQMITKKEFPSYGNWIEQGATSLWESFQLPGDCPESKNHHFFGDIISWFVKKLAGICINPNEVNPNEIALKPHFIPSLSFAKGYYDTTAGKVCSYWEKDAPDKIIWYVEVAEGCSGYMLLPKGYCFEDGSNQKELQNGRFLVVKCN